MRLIHKTGVYEKALGVLLFCSILLLLKMP